MNTIKSQEEWHVMRSFRNCYTDFPKGKLNKSESPDFILKPSLFRSIGIEVSRLMHHEKPDSREIELRSIVQRARDLYKDHFNEPIFVQFIFKDDFFKPINNELYATKISLAIIDAVADQNFKSPVKLHLEPEKLPEGIKRVIIYSNPSIKDSIWDIRSELTIQDLMNRGHIENLVTKKEEKLSLYQKQIHDLYWLVLSADVINKPASFNLEEVLDQLNLESKFNKVFLFDMFENKYYDLV